MTTVVVPQAARGYRAGGREILARLAARFPSVALVWADGGHASRIDASLLRWAYDKLKVVVEIV